MTIITYYLTQNRYSRNGKKMKAPKGIVLHQSMNEGYSAVAERNYMENLKMGKNAIYYGTHYIIGLNGEIINCIPEAEVSYHRGNSEQSDGDISIEYCTANEALHPDNNVRLSIKRLVIDISRRYGFKIDTCVLRHSDVAKKRCPLYYTQNNSKWKLLKKEILEEWEAITELKKNSVSISERLNKMTDINKGYIKQILEQKVSLDALTISKILKLLLETKNE